MKEKITEEMGIQDDWYQRAKEINLDTLWEFTNHLANDYEHDYGTICHACAAAALAAAHAIDHSEQGGITGFQAGAIMWEFISRWMGYEDEPLRLVHYSNMLYPQYRDTFKQISQNTWKWLQEQAKKLLEENKDTEIDKRVKAHWELIANGVIPFEFQVSED